MYDGRKVDEYNSVRQVYPYQAEIYGFYFGGFVLPIFGCLILGSALLMICM